MARIEKTVFISYRRADVYTALAIYETLKNQAYDVFFDYKSISSGDFEQIITSNIKARAHFLLVLTPTALDRLNEPGDWLRREIETAIDEKRNIIPMFFKGFRFGSQSISDTLTGKLANLSRYNGLNVHEDYFDEAMHRLRAQFLNKPLDTVLHPVSDTVQRIVKQEQIAADKALEQIKDVQELVKQGGKESAPKKLSPKLSTNKPVEIVAAKRATNKVPWHMVAGGVIGMALLALSIWGGATILNNFPIFAPEARLTVQPTQPFVSSTETLIPPTPVRSIGSTMTGDDGMTLLYVPAGEFTMGSDTGSDDETPVHTVQLESFWIDKSEVTNKMYSLCVEAGVCQEPTNASSSTHSSYYGNTEFDDYPVLYVNWNMAKTYCEWADRRLPTEAEWEKAARGESTNVYPWGNTLDASPLNFCDTNCSSSWADESSNDGFADVAPAGSFPDGMSVYGVLDMAGNVWEWVNDWYSDSYYSSSPSSNPEGPDSGQYRVLRGGSWFNDSLNVRSSDRNSVAPAYTINSVGFRCAMSATP